MKSCNKIKGHTTCSLVRMLRSSGSCLKSEDKSHITILKSFQNPHSHVFFMLSLHDHSACNGRKCLESSTTVNRKTNLKILVKIQED